MERNEQPFDTISPSALALLRLKSHTDIPFAHEALQQVGASAEMLSVTDTNDAKGFARALIHFENRYKTIDALVEDRNDTNFLELSSGFSFRGLDLCSRKSVTYFDTDLPDVIVQKETLLSKMNLPPLLGAFRLESLNALDEDSLNSLVDKFPQGPVCVLNEGLLMYLERDEKITLAQHIHDVLERRGGCWITGDIYIKRTGGGLLPQSHLFSQFRLQHRIDEKKFEDIEEAARFFHENGFSITRKVDWVFDRLSCLDYLPTDKHEIISRLQQAPVSRETWRLEIAG